MESMESAFLVNNHPVVTQDKGQEDKPAGVRRRLNPFNPFSPQRPGDDDDILVRGETGAGLISAANQRNNGIGNEGYYGSSRGGFSGVVQELLGQRAGNARLEEGQLRRHQGAEGGTHVVEGLLKLSRKARVAVAQQSLGTARGSVSTALPQVSVDVPPLSVGDYQDGSSVTAAGRGSTESTETVAMSMVKATTMATTTTTAAAAAMAGPVRSSSALALAVSPRQTTDRNRQHKAGAKDGSQHKAGRKDHSGLHTEEDGEEEDDEDGVNLARAGRRLTSRLRMYEKVAGRGPGGARRMESRRRDIEVLRSNDFLKSLRGSLWRTNGSWQDGEDDDASTGASHGKKKQQRRSAGGTDETARPPPPKTPSRRQQRPLDKAVSPHEASLALPEHIVPQLRDKQLLDTLRVLTDPTKGVRWPHSKSWEEFTTSSKHFSAWNNLRDESRPLTPRHTYLQACDSLGLRAEPTIVKLVQGAKRDGIARLQSYRLGDMHAKALSEAIGRLSISTINLADNRLTFRGLGAVFTTLQPDIIQKLNISHNILDMRGTKLLVTLVEMAPCLLWLSVENTCLEDVAFARLALALRRAVPDPLTGELIGRPSIRHLNASRNYLGDLSMSALAALCMDQHPSLTNLDISWNPIKASGILLLSPALAATSILQSLDLSWNPVGSPSGQAGNVLGEAVKANKSLTHLDLSFTLMTAADCEAFGQHLKMNHTILGLHMSGNPAGLDSTGSLTLDRRCEDSRYVAHIFTRILSSVFQKVRGRDIWSFRSRCWICEHWKEERFVFNPKKYFYTTTRSENKGQVRAPGERRRRHGDDDEEDEDDETVAFGADVQEVLFHASFDDWTPDVMERTVDGTFVIHRMAPPGLSYYYFLVNGAITPIRRPTSTQLHIEKHPVVTLSAMGRAEIHAGPKVPAELHVCTVDKAMNFSTTMRLSHCYPRHREEVVIDPDLLKRPPSNWTIDQSVFRDFRNDHDALFVAAFHADYAYTRLDSKISTKWPDDVEAAKAVLKRHFYLLKNVFKHYSAAYSSGECFNLGAGGFNEFIQRCGIVDLDGCDRVEVDTQFITVNLSGPKHVFNPRRALTRAQFMEIVVGLAIAKFVKTGICAKPSQAIQQIIDEHIEPRAERDDPIAFRRDVLHKQAPDMLFKEFQGKLKKLFAKYSGAENFPGEDKTMSLSEWASLVEDAGVIDDFLVERSVRLAYVRSKQTELDELNDRKSHRRMVFVEFLEAITRLAHASWKAETAFANSEGQEEGQAELSLPTKDEDFPLSSLRQMIQRFVWLLDPTEKRPSIDDILTRRSPLVEASRRSSISSSRRPSVSSDRSHSTSLAEVELMNAETLAVDESASPI